VLHCPDCLLKLVHFNIGIVRGDVKGPFRLENLAAAYAHNALVYSAERFLRALFNLGTKGKPFTAAQLAQDFGADGDIARTAIRSLYDALLVTDSPKAQVFFSEWKIHFSEVCGYDVDAPTDKIKKLAESYKLPTKGIKAANLLFSLHTYYAFFMKLLAAEVVSSIHQLPGGTPLRRLMQAATPEKLRRELEDLEAGSVFLACTRFRRHRVRCFYGTGGESWKDEGLHASSSLRLCG
jgi:hypothetical protein